MLGEDFIKILSFFQEKFSPERTFRGLSLLETQIILNEGQMKDGLDEVKGPC